MEPDFNKTRIDAVAKAVNFQEWAQTEIRYVAPVINKSLLARPGLVIRESTSYNQVQFRQIPWGKCKWSWGHLIESGQQLPTELPPEREAKLLARLAPELRSDPDYVREYLKRKLDRYRESKRYSLDGEMFVEVCLAPSSRAAQEYLLTMMTQNTMMTEKLTQMYSSAERPQALGTISFLTESTKKDDICVQFVRANLCISIRAKGSFADEALPLARKIDSRIVQQPVLTYQQLIARRPSVTIASKLEGVKGQRKVSYNVSTPENRKIAHVWAPIDGQNAANKDGTISLGWKTGVANIKLTVTTDELLANTCERQVILDE